MPLVMGNKNAGDLLLRVQLAELEAALRSQRRGPQPDGNKQKNKANT